MQDIEERNLLHVMLRGEILCYPLGKKDVNWAEINFVPYSRRNLVTCKVCLGKLEEIEKDIFKSGGMSSLPPPRKQSGPRKQREPRKKCLPVMAAPPPVAIKPPPPPVIPEVVAEVASTKEALEESPMEDIPPKVPKEKKYWFGVEIS